MKSYAVRLGVVALMAIVLAGCPWPPFRGNPEFTSANVNTNSREGLLDGSAPGDEVEYEDDGSGGTVRELVEPDVIRRAGSLLYVLNQYRGLTIVDLDTEAVLSQTSLYGYPRDLYLVGNHAYVLVSYARDIQVVEDLIRVAYGSKLYVLNIQDPENIIEEGVFSFEGDLVDSRMVGSVIYAVSSDYSWYGCCLDGVVSSDAAEKSYGSTGAISINIADPANIQVVDRVSFDGYGNLIQATNYAIFVVTNDYYSNNNHITYVDINDPSGNIVVRGAATVPGYMADRFKMDAWEGALRVVTNTWWPDRETYITTFDISDPDTMVQLGQTTLESASGESLFATRFDGPLAYVVTYFTVDPLFVVDLSDPTAPTVLGELKIPGWSTHIEPRGDRLIALGVDDEDGFRVMVSLFDVSDPETPLRLDYASFGDGWSWSSAFGDVKAFTVLDDMILVPFSGWNHGSDAGYDRLQFVGYSRDTLDVQGYVDLQGSVVRSFAYGDRYYAVTQEQLAVIDGGDPSGPVVENTVALAENVADVLPLNDGWVIEVVVRNDTGDTLVRAVNYAADAIAGELVVPLGAVSEAFVWNNMAVLVAPVYENEPDYRAYYRVVQVDFSDLAAPAVERTWTVDMNPWWGGWWWRGGYGLDAPAETDASGKMMYFPWYYNQGGTAFLVGDYLVLRGYRDRFPATIGGRNASEGLAVLDLSGPDEVRFLGLAYEVVSGMEASGNLLYITSCDEIRNGFWEPSTCAYYLQTLDPRDLSVGPRINVPGTFLERDADTGHILLEDMQYVSGGGVVKLVRSVRISGSRAQILDSVELPQGYWDLLADGKNIFIAGAPYTPGYYYDDVYYGEPGAVDGAPGGKQAAEGLYTVGQYMLSSTGTIVKGPVRAVGYNWCSLLGIRQQKAYLTVAGSAVACYDFNETPPALTALQPTMSYPGKIRFGLDVAYVPLGYGGVVVLE